MRAFVEKHHSRRVDDVRLNTRDVDCFRDVLDPDDVVVGRSTNLFVKSSYYCVSVSVRGRSKKIVPSLKNIISQEVDPSRPKSASRRPIFLSLVVLLSSSNLNPKNDA